ncbi:thiamine diphosphokinase [Cohnella faecalis]|uniref:Thiamine diphosphokinase n=1 Tax=Cohnella faecalis TaxID=2315694 RepID=A0A398CQS9_9BACL|nr:thiamine diphosphokinase [Cohnella faecalis]
MNHSERQPSERAVIFTGGRLGSWAFPHIGDSDFLIGADRGASFLVEHGYAPDLALGDFDSVDANQMTRIRQSAKELLIFDAIDKDWTDTELALNEALSRGYRQIAIIGGLGTRFDHSLANVHLLRQAVSVGCDASLIDEHNEIFLCTSECRLPQDERFPYVSLLPLTSEVTGIELQGFQYPLHNATLRIGWTLGISNVIAENTGVVKIDSGELFVIKSRD